jgi:hypothetical protein
MYGQFSEVTSSLITQSLMVGSGYVYVKIADHCKPSSSLPSLLVSNCYFLFVCYYINCNNQLGYAAMK